KWSFFEVYNEVLKGEQIPPHYFYIVFIFFKIFGNTILVARSISLIAGIFSVLGIYQLLNEFKLKREALVAALLLAVNYFHIYYSQEARPYALLVTFSIYSFLYFVKAIKDKRNINFIIYSIFTGFMVSFHLFGLLVLFAQAIIFLLFLSQNKNYLQKKIILQLLLSFIIIAIIFIPSIEILIKSQNIKEFWIGENDPFAIRQIVLDLFANSEFLISFFIVAIILYVQKLSNFNGKETLNANNNLLLNLVTLIWIFIIVLIPIIKSYTSVPMLLNRYFICLLPPLLIVFSIGINQIKNKILFRTVILMYIIFSIVDLLAIKNYYYKPEKSQFDKASEYVISKMKKDETVTSSLAFYFQYYFDTKQSKTIVQSNSLDQYINEIKNDSTKIKPFWYIDGFGREYKPNEATLAFINNNFYIDYNYDGFQAWAKHFVLTSELLQSLDLSGLNFEKDYSGDSFMFNLEVFEIVNNKVILSGWAYFDGISSENSKISIVLINKKTDIKKTKTIPIQLVVRQDVTSYFKCDFNADNSGFKAEYDISNLDDEDYVIGIYLENKNYNKKGLFISDKKVLKNNSY
ncbi:MAG: glycosyltransferase family 39 protein, partial [Flavobacteriaceae bacterium]|nr:glycosyltransferase family 39 protein [Flavobacteriaceae bacterium]